MKKYCRKCRWYNDAYSNRLSESCFIKGKLKKHKITGIYYRDTTISNPEKENKDNNCKYYKRNWLIL